jgi:hypothetical protein
VEEGGSDVLNNKFARRVFLMRPALQDIIKIEKVGRADLISKWNPN